MRRLIVVGVFFLMAGALFRILVWIPRVTAVELLAEHGPLELVSSLLYLIGAAILLRIASNASPPDYGGSIVLAGLALAELGLWSWVVGWNQGFVPARLGGLALLIVALAATLLHVKRHWQGFWRAWRAGRPGAILVFTGVAALVVTLVMDRIAKGMVDRGPLGDRYVLGMAEEAVELLIPVVFLLAIWMWWKE